MDTNKFANLSQFLQKRLQDFLKTNLIKVERRCFVGTEPNGIACRLTELITRFARYQRQSNT